jgi:hypothetical protein
VIDQVERRAPARLSAPARYPFRRQACRRRRRRRQDFLSEKSRHSLAPSTRTRHSKEVAAATKTPRGHAAIVAGAKSLAMTAIDILADETLREEAKQEHRRAMAGEE